MYENVEFGMSTIRLLVPWVIHKMNCYCITRFYKKYAEGKSGNIYKLQRQFGPIRRNIIAVCAHYLTLERRDTTLSMDNRTFYTIFLYAFASLYDYTSCTLRFHPSEQ